MMSLLQYVIGRGAIVGPVLILGAVSARREGTDAPSDFSTEKARVHELFRTAAAGPTDLAFEMAGETTDIYRINIDGTGLTRLTNAGAFNGNAAWSPDGTKIAFSSHRDGEGAIYVMNADGSGQVRLTVGLDATQPQWSPDGTKIVFMSLGYDNGAFNTDPYVMNADGTNIIRLTRTAGGDFAPSWSPDSRRIAFSSQRNGREEIYLINADGTGTRRLLAGASLGSEQYPAWSPDGTKIAFTVIYAWASEDIFVANADGSALTRLAQDGEEPAWSPDGSKLAFIRFSNCNDFGCWNSELLSINADGSSATQLTVGGYSEQISWSRDGSWIAFHAYDCDEPYGSCSEVVRLVKPDGSQLTDLASGAAGPAWKP